MFLWHFPSARAARPLAGTLSGGVPTFLPRGSPRVGPPPATVRSPVPPDYGTASGPAGGMTWMSAGGSSTTQRRAEATPSTS